MKSHTQYIPITAFHDGAYIESEEEFELNQDNILVPADMQSGDVKNMARDENDTRNRSSEDYYENGMTGDQVEQSIHDLEKQMLAEAGGAEERARIIEEMDKRREEAAKQLGDKAPKSTPGGETGYSGQVMVDFSVPNHTAYQNNVWYVRNPGYTCPSGSQGKVTVIIKVDKSGNVTSAVYDASQSQGANSCMISKAKTYAMKSRFNYADSAPASQTGRITYTFISK
ncbi:MAG: hypothetical protein MK066_05230 [Crocinitomicaceae bacterium]|nr:hypothetical protein [Crocinitomicaceae bacterium]